MTLISDVHNESDKLVQQLAGMRYIVGASLRILDKDQAGKEFLAFKMEIASSYVEELQVWKTLVNQRPVIRAQRNSYIPDIPHNVFEVHGDL